MIEHTIIVHSVEEDGLPDTSGLTGQVAFIWDGALVSGWPVSPDEWDDDPLDIKWEASEDRMGGGYAGVTHWVELPVPVWMLHKG